ncbi:Olfactory receptor 4F15 [Microtus ochrogaster]|uniref:Olfactory receptor 4F15 n=1 Tax=Microtus ochrogaster TaxID=79684 RepID=A0A8J6G4D9_MICOH|nr:Olfactory receptor 4F15 [Microtus ochrogaster]
MRSGYLSGGDQGSTETQAAYREQITPLQLNQRGFQVTIPLHNEFILAISSLCGIIWSVILYGPISCVPTVAALVEMFVHEIMLLLIKRKVLLNKALFSTAMDGNNHSVVSEFVFLGLSNTWGIQLLLFFFSSVFYTASLMGNLLIVFSVTADSNLHSPMYFLLANLSFLDLGGCSVAAPKMIYDLFRKHKSISFGGCITQIFFIHAIGGTEMVLLIAMAFERYVAILSLMGNLLIVFSVTADSNLHFPMYFLLANLSFLDLEGCSIAAPKMIYDLFRKHKPILFGGCITQIFFIHAIGDTEMVLLIAMAFDRYVAICKPLHYLTIMRPGICILLLSVAWILRLIHSVAQLAFVVDLPFCGPNILDSFYCDLPQLIKLACTETNQLEFVVTANSGLISLGSFFIVIVSYIFILVTVRKHSSGGISKALSTLSAHVTVVVLFFGPLIFFYIWPFPSSHLDKFLAIFDAVLTPFLNPVISMFRNKEMKAAMSKLCYQLLSYRKVS